MRERALASRPDLPAGRHLRGRFLWSPATHHLKRIYCLAMADARLGPLERRVMEALWAHEDAARVRDLKPHFPEIAYTTLMTTLGRLHRKGLLERVCLGRAFAYRPRLSRTQLQLQDAAGPLRRLLTGGTSIEPVLSLLLDEVTAQDDKALDQLERLIRERRRTLDEERR